MTNAMTLSSWIRTLEGLPKLMLIEFDFGRSVGPLISWRGVYAMLSLDHGEAGRTSTVEEVLANARAAVGAEFDGYKGGTFRMGLDTEVWADGYGTADGRHPTGVRVDEDKIVVLTAFDESVWS